jgi:hypothetical protein
MKLPSFRRIFSSDYKEEMKQFVDQFGVIYNGNTEVLYDALNNKLTLKENFAATITEFSVAVNDSGVPLQTTTVRMSNNQTTVEGIVVLTAVGGRNGDIMPLAAPYIDAIKDGNLLTIKHVTGLVPGVSYRIKAVVYA